MVYSLFLFIINFLWQTPEPPLKPDVDFQLRVEYMFKQRPTSNSGNVAVDFESDKLERRTAEGPLPYLIVYFKVLKLAENEVRVKVVTESGRTVVTRKAREGEEFKLDLGYTDDMKDRVASYLYTIYFLSAEKTDVSRVQMFIGEDGTFLVNGEKRGKF
jgi:hypothetical protein